MPIIDGSPLSSKPPEAGVEISSRQFADIVVAVPVGRIDHSAASKFMEGLAPHLDAPDGNAGVVIDFAGVDYISSVGLRVLMIAAKQMREHQAQLLVAELQDVVAEIFAISRFDRVLTLVPTLDDAMARCSPAAQASYREGAGSSR